MFRALKTPLPLSPAQSGGVCKTAQIVVLSHFNAWSAFRAAWSRAPMVIERPCFALSNILQARE